MHIGLRFVVPIFLTQSICLHSIISLLDIVPLHCLQTSSADTAPTGMSDKDKADFYHLQAVQAKQDLQEACVLYMSKVQQVQLLASLCSSCRFVFVAVYIVVCFFSFSFLSLF